MSDHRVTGVVTGTDDGWPTQRLTIEVDIETPLHAQPGTLVTIQTAGEGCQACAHPRHEDGECAKRTTHITGFLGPCLCPGVSTPITEATP